MLKTDKSSRKWGGRRVGAGRPRFPENYGMPDPRNRVRVTVDVDPNELFRARPDMREFIEQGKLTRRQALQIWAKAYFLAPVFHWGSVEREAWITGSVAEHVTKNSG